MHVVNAHLTAVQQRKAKKGAAFQLSASAMSQPPNTHIVLNTKPKQSQFLRNQRNGKGFRFQAQEYQLMPENSQGGDIAFNGGKLVGEIVTEGGKINIKKIANKANVKVSVSGGKLVKGSQEAKDRMAKMRAMRKGGSVAAADSDMEDSDDEVEGGKLRLGRKINKAFNRKKVKKGFKAAKKGVVDTYRSKEFKAVADVTTDAGLAYAQSQGYINKDQAGDLRKLKRAAIHEDMPGLKKAARSAAKNEAGRQLNGGALKEPAVKRKPKGTSNVTMYPNIPKTIKGKGFRPAGDGLYGAGISGSGFMPVS